MVNLSWYIADNVWGPMLYVGDVGEEKLNSSKLHCDNKNFGLLEQE